jgi:tetratricopeptide (TPR) repeat protein
LQPDFGRAFHNRGLAWEKKGDPTRALADYEAALSLDPRMTAALVQRAGLREAKGDIDGAKADLTAATSAPPKYFDGKPAQDIAREGLVRLGNAPKSP